MTTHTDACIEAFPLFIPAVIASGEKYEANEKITKLVASIIFYVSKQTEVVPMMYDAKVVPLLLQRLAKHATLEEELIRYYICALSYIMVNDEVTRYTFEETDGMKVEDTWFHICTILYNHYQNCKIGAACCYLASSCTTTIEEVERLKKFNVPANMYDTVTHTIDNEFCSSTITGAFTFCYRILMSGFGHEILNHDDCVSMISKGMQAFPENIVIQLKGVKVLREYSLHKATVEMMKKNEAIERLVDSLNVAAASAVAFWQLRK